LPARALGSLSSLFLQKARGFDTRDAGLALSVLFLAGAFGNPLFGGLSDGGRKRWTFTVLLIATALMALFPHVSARGEIVLLGAIGFFFLASYPMVEAALMESVPDAVRGRIYGMFITVGGLVGQLSHWIAGYQVNRLGDSAHQSSSYFSALRRARGPVARVARGPALSARHPQMRTPGRNKMNLPNYFLADLPPEAVLSPRHDRRGVPDVEAQPRALPGVAFDREPGENPEPAGGWLAATGESVSPARAEAWAGATGFSRETLARGLDGFFGQFTRDNFHALLVQEFGDTNGWMR